MGRRRAGVAAQNTLMGDGPAPATWPVLPTPSCPLQPPVWMRGYRVRVEAALIGPHPTPLVCISPYLAVPSLPPPFAKAGASFRALRSLQKKSSSIQGTTRSLCLPSLIIVCFSFSEFVFSTRWWYPSEGRTRTRDFIAGFIV